MVKPTTAIAVAITHFHSLLMKPQTARATEAVQCLFCVPPEMKIELLLPISSESMYGVYSPSHHFLIFRFNLTLQSKCYMELFNKNFVNINFDGARLIELNLTPT